MKYLRSLVFYGSVVLSSFTLAQDRSAIEYIDRGETRAALDNNQLKYSDTFVSSELYQQIRAQRIDDWPENEYLWEYDNLGINKSKKSHISLTPEQYYDIGLQGTWKAVALQDGYVLLIGTEKSPALNLHPTMILHFDGEIFTRVYLADDRFHLAAKGSKVDWRYGKVTSPETRQQFWFIDNSSQQYISVLNKAFGNADALFASPWYQRMPREEHQRYQTYLSYLRPAYQVAQRVRSIKAGEGMTSAQVDEFVHTELLPVLSTFAYRYRNDVEAREHQLFQQTLAVSEELLQGGSEMILSLKNLAIRNQIDKQLELQKKGAVSGYTDLTVYVAENQLEKLTVALEQADNINSHFDNWTALNQAAQDGYLPAAKLLVKQGADLEIRTQNYSPLISALAKRKDEMAEFLILNGADVNVRIWKNLETPLILAAKLNQVKLVEVLLAHGAELWAQSYAGDTAWQWAKHKGHKEMIKHFRSVNAQGGFDAFDAIETGNVSGFKRAVKKTGNLYQLHPEDDALSLLSSAAKYGRVEMVSYLLDQGIDINFSALNDVTAAFTAAKNNQVTALALLIQNGADLGLQKGYAPLHTASFRGHIDVVRLLVEQGGTDIMLTANNSGGTPLHMAAEGGQLEVVKYLLSQPQYRDLTHAPVDKTGATPLISLFKYKQDNRAIFALLNEQDWNDISVKDIRGKTAYDYAKKAGLNDYLPRLAR